MATMPQSAVEILDDRLERLMDRLKQVEKWCAQKPTVALDLRFTLIDEHLKQLEARLGVTACPKGGAHVAAGARLPSLMCQQYFGLVLY